MSSKIILVAFLVALDYISATTHRIRGSKYIMYDFPSSETNIIPTEVKWVGRIRRLDVDTETGSFCECAGQRPDWTEWSTCSSRSGGCYSAEQLRTRKCSPKCNRIQIRTCLNISSCTGRWGQWKRNSSCSKCNENGMKLTRFCAGVDGTIGPFCPDGAGKFYQERQIPCSQACENELLTRNANPYSSNPAYRGNLVVILLAVVAGVLLVALIFVSVLLTSLKNRNYNQSSMTQDRRSFSESNMSATSYLSAIERESRTSAKASIYQQNKSSVRRSQILPHTFSGSSSVRVRGTMNHTDSLMLARKHLTGKRAYRGSLRSINKLAREKERDEKCTEDMFSIQFRNRNSKLKRRATDGEYDTYDRQKKEKNFAIQRSINYGSTGATSKVTSPDDLMNYDDTQHLEIEVLSSDGSEKSEEDMRRLSVEDIRRRFENHSLKQDYPDKKSCIDIPHDQKLVRDNISRIEITSGSSMQTKKTRRILESFKRKKALTAEATTPKSEPEVTQAPEKVRAKDKSDINSQTAKEMKVNSCADDRKIKNKSFLFSPQAYNSLQRSEGRSETEQNRNKKGYKINVDALMQKMENAKGDNEQNSSAVTSQRDRPKSFDDVSPKKFVIPTRREVRDLVDSDAYADVWDARIKTEEEKSRESIYADVWDSDTPSRKSYCENDDDDYSEVFDVTSNMGNIAKAREFAANVNWRNRLSSHGTPPRPRSLTERKVDSMSARSTPTSLQRNSSRDIFNRTSGHIFEPDRGHNSGNDNDPIYAVI